MKAVCLLSGGIDSPVAAKLAAENGTELIFLHAKIGKKNEDKLKKLAEIISPDSKLVKYNHYDFMNKVKDKCEIKYSCILCKRQMYKEAEKLAIKEGAECIITGESIGQVASQTLKNLKTLEYGIKIPIIRPLIGMSKADIILLAKKFKTYPISIIENLKCPFVPAQPSTEAKIEKIIEEEKLLSH